MSRTVGVGAGARVSCWRDWRPVRARSCLTSLAPCCAPPAPPPRPAVTIVAVKGSTAVVPSVTASLELVLMGTLQARPLRFNVSYIQNGVISPEVPVGE